MISPHSRPNARINPLDLKPQDIRIEDVAHSLALINRFNGHTAFPISVAQHSCWVSWLCEPAAALQGLLHDASEYVLGDCTKFLKQTPPLAGFRAAEDRAQRVIYEVFGCVTKTAPSVEWADRVMVRWEGERGFGPDWCVEDEPGVPHPHYPALTNEERAALRDWVPWSWQTSEEMFLTRFYQLTGLRQGGFRHDTSLEPALRRARLA